MAPSTVGLLSAAVCFAAATALNPVVEWENFKANFGKKYENSTEELRRMRVYYDNVEIIRQQNENPEDTAMYAVNEFSDMTPEEFANAYLMPNFKPVGPSGGKILDNLVFNASVTYKNDWVGKLTTPVKNQQQCGSCWAFSATEQIESDTMRELGKTYELSPQQIVSCDHVDLGCNGGNTETAYKYVKQAGGIVENSDYPYTSGFGLTGMCKTAKCSHKMVTVSDYTTVRGEDQMAAYVSKTGPLSVCVDASSWQNYRGGVKSFCSKQIDHCVQAVGIDTDAGVWKVRNSWGTTWGESGFIRLAYGRDTCGITNDPTFVTVTAV